MKLNDVLLLPAALLIAGSLFQSASAEIMFAEERTDDAYTDYNYYYDDEDYEDYADLPTISTVAAPVTLPTTTLLPETVTLPAEICSAGGPSLKEDRYTMLGSAMMVFPAVEVTCEGEISQWEFLPFKENISQLYFAVWHRTNPTKEYEFGLRGMNNPDVLATSGRWNRWVVPEDKRIEVKKGDIIGYFYVNWVVNVSELIIPLAVPKNEFDKEFFRTVDSGVFAAMMGLADVVQRHNGIVDFAKFGVYLPHYAIPPIKAIVSFKTTRATLGPFDKLIGITQRDSLPNRFDPERCKLPPKSNDENFPTDKCEPEQFVRYFFSWSLQTCVYFRFETCTEIPGKMPPIISGNNFDDVDDCKKICRDFLNKTVAPIEHTDDYNY